MTLKGIIDTDTINYKKISMVLEFPICKNFKCDKECGQQVCQNSALATAPNIEVDVDAIIQRYLDNPITEAIVCQGLEPFDTLGDLWNFLIKLRRTYHCDDDVVIYTGYTKEELASKFPSHLNLYALKIFRNIIIKFGRYIPGQQPHYDEVLGVDLASDNQYAERIS